MSSSCELKCVNDAGGVAEADMEIPGSARPGRAECGKCRHCRAFFPMFPARRRQGANIAALLHALPVHARCPVHAVFAPHAVAADGRSEEHTSELQSLMRISYAVFCLKKTNQNQNTIRTLNQNR